MMSSWKMNIVILKMSSLVMKIILYKICWNVCFARYFPFCETGISPALKTQVFNMYFRLA